MSFPPNLLVDNGPNSWSLTCSKCPKIEEFREEYFFKALRDVADSDWELIEGEAVCPLCLEDSKEKYTK